MLRHYRGESDVAHSASASLITSSATQVSASTNLNAPTQALVFLSMRDVSQRDSSNQVKSAKLHVPVSSYLEETEAVLEHISTGCVLRHRRATPQVKSLAQRNDRISFHRFREAIADTWLCQEILWICWIVFNLDAQLPDETLCVPLIQDCAAISGSRSQRARSTQPLRDSDGQVRYWVGVNIDIDDKKRASEALDAARERIGRAIQSAAIAEPPFPASAAFAWRMLRLSEEASTRNVCWQYRSRDTPTLRSSSS
jgi:hypothetical protein